MLLSGLDCRMLQREIVQTLLENEIVPSDYVDAMPNNKMIVFGS